jgi:D-alanyl-D-alanine carboxypeptidase
MFRKYIFLSFILVISVSSCQRRNEIKKNDAQNEVIRMENVNNSGTQELLLRALETAETPEKFMRKILNNEAQFLSDIKNVFGGDKFLYLLIDKTHALPDSYEPEDLIELQNGNYRVSRNGLKLRQAASAALLEMALAARNEGVTLVVSSTYRSESYQKTVYERIVREEGREQADRESARPGHSQHQSGLVVDFGSITDEFAGTSAGRWLLKNANTFGWSLSFPDGYESVTGYRWECWHYRYVGRELCDIFSEYFDGIQQYGLEFLYAASGILSY